MNSYIIFKDYLKRDISQLEFEVAKLGERGQVVIPQEFRETMNLQKGDKFIVIEHGDTLIFKRISHILNLVL